jgi:molybdate transport system ATP-binding protein
MTVSITLDFSLRQGDFALDIQEQVEARVVALFGPSGSGKTTVLESIAGLRSPERGVIRIGNRTLYDADGGVDVPPHERHIGYVPQDLALFPHMNVTRNILYGANAAHDVGSAAALEQVLSLLELWPLLERGVGDLSGGERQRVAIARALTTSPLLLLLDEPLTALDSGLRARILPYLERIRDELATPIVYVSHDEAEIRAMADWVVELELGRATRSGPWQGDS